MNPLIILLRLFVACLLAGWIPFLWLGIDLWQTGIQKQINGHRGGSSFPYEDFGRSCVQWACLWGFCASAGFMFWCFCRPLPAAAARAKAPADAV